MTLVRSSGRAATSPYAAARPAHQARVSDYNSCVAAPVLAVLQALAEALQNNCTLAVLNLKANYIGDEGAIALAKVARRSKSLRALITTSNDIEHAGDKALEDALYENDSLVDYMPVEVMCRF